MSFVAWQYPIFLGLILLVYWLLPLRPRQLLLLVGSYFFYAFWDVRFLALILATSNIDYLIALSLSGRKASPGRVLLLSLIPALWLSVCHLVTLPSGLVPLSTLLLALGLGLAFFAAYQVFWLLPEAKRPRAFIVLSLGFCLGILGFFKYFGFFTDSAIRFLQSLGLEPGWVLPHIILPVGISFFTFQSLGYVFDVYRGKTEVCADYLTFVVYVSFFPQLVAGPIERASHLIPQLAQKQTFTPACLHDGLRMLLIGFFKKVFVADNCAMLANYAFDPQTSLNGYWAVLGTVAFAFQIYGDFSGYSDIARGSAKLLGIDLMQNFRFPYVAKNPSDFWSRWHISLSTWFRDYLYIPLGGNRGSRGETVRNLAVTMLLAGFWHGASWIFIIWGAYHAALLIFSRFSRLSPFVGKDAPFSLHTLASIMLMWVVTLVGWAIFRSASLAQLGGWFAALGTWQAAGAMPWLGSAQWLLIHVAPLILLQILTWKDQDETSLVTLPWQARGVVYAVLLVMVVTSTQVDQEFIYFQF